MHFAASGYSLFADAPIYGFPEYKGLRGVLLKYLDEICKNDVCLSHLLHILISLFD